MAKLEYLDNCNPPVCAVADYICKIVSEAKSADFSDSIFFLPTHSAVRLTKSLVLEKLSKYGIKAVMGFRIMTPEMFFSEITRGTNIANSFQSAYAWNKAFAENGNLPNLFKTRTPDKSDYPHLADEFSALRKDIAQAGKTFRDAAYIFSKYGDGDRWNDMAVIEDSYLSALESMDVEASETASVKAVRAKLWTSTFPNLKNVRLIGLPDAPTLLIQAVEEMERDGVEVTAVVFADEKIAVQGRNKYFDAYGIPEAVWIDEDMPIKDGRIFGVDSVSVQAEICAQALKKNRDTDISKLVSVVCNEHDSVPLLTDKLAEGENPIEAYSPQGKSIGELGIGRFLKDLLKITREGGFRAYLDILKNSFLLDKVKKVVDSDTSSIISAVEKLALKRMPKDLNAALNLKSPLDKNDALSFYSAQKIISVMRGLLFPPNVKSAVSRFREIAVKIFFEADDTLWSFEGEKDLVLKFLAEQISQMNSVNSAAFDFDEILEIVLKNAFERNFAESKNENAIPLLDWMEVFWTPQPYIIINDFNSGILPSKSGQNAFLPDSKRAGMGLRSADARRARDAYMFYTILRSRQKNGQVWCIAPKTRGNGDIVSPSELLLQCPQNELPRRVEKLFEPSGNFQKPLTADKNIGFLLPFKELKKSELSPSAIKSYLACPFRFYLRYVLKMEVNDYTRDELDAMAVGTFMHKVWERFASGKHRDSEVAEEIEKTLSDNFNALAAEFFGNDISGALAIQLASLKKSLPAYAQKQAEHRRQGWKIKYDSELVIDDFYIGNYKIKMRIDRVDENENGDILIIDYKTFDKVEARKGISVAETKHIERKRDEITNELLPKWVDLQLPIYLSAYKRKYKPLGKVKCAYFIMSKNAEDSGIDIWDIEDREFEDENMLENAMGKAEEVVDAIENRKFEPNDGAYLKHDDYEKIFSFAEGNISFFKIDDDNL